MLTDTQLSRALGDAKLSIFHGIKEDLATNTFMFGDAIASLGMPNVGSRSVIFDYVKSPITFLDYMLKGKVEDLCGTARFMESVGLIWKYFQTPVPAITADMIVEIGRAHV